MSEKSIRIVTFTGKRNDWRQWSKKFLAVAEKREYRSILEVDPDKLDIKVDLDERKKKNSLAYNDLLLAMTEDVSFGLVDEATSTTYPEGDAWIAWGKLMQRYESQTNASRVKLMGQFTSSKLKKNTQDPDPWISELELMRIRLKKMGSNINDEYLMMHIMNNLPSAYDGLIENLEDMLDSTSDPLPMSILRDKVSEKYEKIKRRKGIKDEASDSEDEEERALFAKRFKGRCRKCGKFGHKAADCKSDIKKGPWTPSKKNGGGGSRVRFQGKCNYCGKYGHKEADCWAKQGKIKTEETNNQAVEDDEEDEVEVVLMSMENNDETEMPEIVEVGSDHEEGPNEDHNDENNQDQHDSNGNGNNQENNAEDGADDHAGNEDNDGNEDENNNEDENEANNEEQDEADEEEDDEADDDEEVEPEVVNEVRVRIIQPQINQEVRVQWNLHNVNARRALRDGNNDWGRRNNQGQGQNNQGWGQRRNQFDPRWISIHFNRDWEEKKDDHAHASMEMELALGSPKEIENLDTSLWLGDTGASCHMTNNLDGMFNRTKIDSGIVFGNGQRLKAECIGDKRGLVVQKDRSKSPILMKNVKCVPQLYCNLFSITAALGEGCKLTGDIKNLTLMKNDKIYVFDRKVKSGKSTLFAMKIISNKKKP